jgi:hypothetical protein
MILRGYDYVRGDKSQKLKNARTPTIIKSVKSLRIDLVKPHAISGAGETQMMR